MLVELIAFLGAVGIAVTIFVIIAMLADNPIHALVTALILLYPLFFVYIYSIEKIAKRKEERRATE
jgi:Ca2+/Na+ antiporter